MHAQYYVTKTKLGKDTHIKFEYKNILKIYKNTVPIYLKFKYILYLE